MRIICLGLIGEVFPENPFILSSIVSLDLVLFTDFLKPLARFPNMLC